MVRFSQLNSVQVSPSPSWTEQSDPLYLFVYLFDSTLVQRLI